jgi:hypothetical protein
LANTPTRDVDDVASVVIRGARAWDKAGSHVASAGDVNGDGVTDMLITALRQDRGAARVYVLWGGRSPGRVSLGRLGGGGFVIRGVDNGVYGSGVAHGVGDVNGDGLADIAVAAPDAGHHDRARSGSVYVVFGKRGRTAVDLAAFDAGTQGDAGYRIDGPVEGALLSWDVDRAGDANGDGLADLVVGAPGIGSTFVVYGKATTAPHDLADLQMRTDMDLGADDGYRIDHPTSNTLPFSVTGAGDVNDDGRPDVVIATRSSIYKPGRAWMVFGPRTRTGILDPAVHVDVTADDFAGYVIKGADKTFDLGPDVERAGDVNADGTPDIVLAAPGYQPFGLHTDRDSHAYVIYGKRSKTPIRLDQLGRHGLDIVADLPGIIDVAGVGDVNRDGHADISAGNPTARNHAGVVYLFHGCACRHHRQRFGDRGVAITGHRDRVYFGRAGEALSTVAGIGDQNGDHRPDLLLGAPDAGPGDRELSGKAYTISARRLTP